MKSIFIVCQENLWNIINQFKIKFEYYILKKMILKKDNIYCKIVLKLILFDQLLMWRSGSDKWSFKYMIIKDLRIIIYSIFYQFILKT